MIVRTKDNGNPKGKPRVFFACHPSDFGRSFDVICNDIYRTHDVTFYSMDRGDNYEVLKTDLIQMNLFVIPVSFRLLTEHSFAIDFVLPLSKKEHIPLLPIMIEHGLDYIYKRDDKFGTIQYLDMNPSDNTGIGYRKKLKNYLDAVIVNDELARRVRKAFDAYVFLSYRKKDRIFANELMRLIHRDPVCRDIAIWYDEYLVPGEKFDEAIVKAMKKSKLFTLLVTPNLVNEKNYVQTEEYPRARRSGIDIFPVEMVETDHDSLEQHFPEIPRCVGTDDEKLFRELFVKAVGKTARTQNDTPEHDFLIGLAYLDGIDVETDRTRAVALITKAAESELPEAIEKLSNMYYEGIGVERNLPTALAWEEKLADIYRNLFYDSDPKLVSQQNELGNMYADGGKWKKAIEMHRSVYESYKMLYGEDNPDTLDALNNLAFEYDQIGDQEKAFKLHEQVFSIRGRSLGYRNRETLRSMYNMIIDLISTGQRSKKMLKMAQRLYRQQKKTLGEYDSDTLNTLEAMAIILDGMGKKKKSAQLYIKIYESRVSNFGNSDIETINAFRNLTVHIINTGHSDIALDMIKILYEKYTEILGADHPETLRLLYYLAQVHIELGDYDKATVLSNEVYKVFKSMLGDDHPYTQDATELMNSLWI